MSQSYVAHLRKDSLYRRIYKGAFFVMVGSAIVRQSGGRPKFLADRNKMCCVTLVIEGQFGIAYWTTKQLGHKISRLLFDITVRRVLIEARLGAQVQQMKPFLSCKHVLACVSFSQRYENWTIDDWKHMIFNDETKINRCHLDGRSRCWIGDGERIGPQHVH